MSAGRNSNVRSNRYKKSRARKKVVKPARARKKNKYAAYSKNKKVPTRWTFIMMWFESKGSM